MHKGHMILVNELAGTFGSMAALLASFTDRLIHNAADAVARLGDLKIKHHSKARSVKTVLAEEKRAVPWQMQLSPQGQAGELLKVSGSQIWIDLLA